MLDILRKIRNRDLRRGNASKMAQRTVSKSANSESRPRRKSMRKKMMHLDRIKWVRDRGEYLCQKIANYQSAITGYS